MTFKEKRTVQILQAAYKVFVEKGFEWATMQDVAEEAGLGVATVFRYFPKKNKLIIAVIVKLLQERLPSFERIYESEGTCYEKFEMLLNHYIKASDSLLWNDMKLLEAFETYAAFAQEPMEDIAEYHQAYANITNVIAKIIEEGKHDGSIRPEVANVDTLGAISNIFGLFTRKLSFFESVRMGEMVILPVEQALRMRDLFLDYLKPLPGEHPVD
ncbi:TetR/AcrR family transcriptional regulator [Sporosarcina sp. Te-1]|uniref:TetR/AcrR family transcriptional regulator n=1 Tax=Sporosarcina sp. Te-1 TaxID=2818390 RepID=UPI001A9F01C7|nr:TetR/AcrR family transcriptional regulator [Sporosarcina sp. Te-1]QTD41785.1 TetR/AcrR family transcriptional regulator [Sporosarcina sp. Te-1]